MDIKSIRKQRGITSTEVAHALGVTQGYYSFLENGKRRFTSEQVEQLSKLLHISFDSLSSLTNLVFDNTQTQENWLTNLPVNGIPLSTWLSIESSRIDLQSKSRFKQSLVRMIKNNIEKELEREFSAQPQLLEALFERAKRSQSQIIK